MNYSTPTVLLCTTAFGIRNRYLQYSTLSTGIANDHQDHDVDFRDLGRQSLIALEMTQQKVKLFLARMLRLASIAFVALALSEGAGASAFTKSIDNVNNRISTTRLLLRENESNRRTILVGAFGLCSFASFVGSPSDAQAVQPRNEVLCDSGLFDNFLEYRCTPLGNIEDEGAGRKLSESEESTTNSLISKLMTDQNSVVAIDEAKRSDPSKSGPAKIVEKHQFKVGAMEH